MIDIHCHILPGLDDGPADVEESISMARTAADDGITAIVATPHLKDFIYPKGLVETKVATLNKELDKRGIKLRVLQGFDVNALLPPSLLSACTLNGTSYILLEFPHTHLPRNAGEILFRMSLAGFTSIITHPERNYSVVEDPSRILSLVNENVLLQITAGSLTGEFGKESRECALHLLKKKAVSFIASDAHSNTMRRPVLSEGLKAAEKVVGKDYARQLVEANPEAVIRGIALSAA